MMGRKDKKAFGAHYRGRDCMFHVKRSGTQIERPVGAAASVIGNAREVRSTNMSASAGVPFGVSRGTYRRM